LNAVKDKVVEAAHAGMDKTQEVLHDYVLPTAQAGIEKTQEVYNDYVAPTAAHGKKIIKIFFYIILLF
jgi:hypothetical protein